MGTAEYDSNDADGQDLGSGEKLETADTAIVAAKAPPPPPAEAPASSSGAMYTMLAREGVNVAQLLNTSLAKRSLGKLTPRRLEVVAPIGQSTQGGKMARQSVTLVPTSGEGPSVMCGWLDAAHKLAEFRDYADVAEQYKSRFGQTFEVTAEEYTTLVKDLTRMLSPLGFRIGEEDEEEEQPSAARRKAKPAPRGATTHPWKTIAWVVGSVIVGAVVAFALS